METCKKCGKKCVREYCHRHGQAQKDAVKRYFQKHKTEFNKYKREWYQKKAALKKEVVPADDSSSLLEEASIL